MAEVKLPRPIIYPGSTKASNRDVSCSLVFQVFSDNRLTDDGLKVLEFTSIPPLGSPYRYGGVTYYNLRSKDYTPKFVKNWGATGAIWDVEVSYDNTLKSGDPPAPSEGDPFTITPRMEKIEIPMEYDLDGVPVRNSAGQKFDTPPMLDLHYPVFTISRTEYTNPCRRQIEFINRVNELEFWGFVPGRVCLLNMSPSTSVSWGAPSWQVQYDIGINPYNDIDLWQTEILNAGFFEKYLDSESSGVVKIRAILDSQGKEISDPVPLDEHGQKLPDDGEPVWFWYRSRLSADLNLLNLPNPFLV